METTSLSSLDGLTHMGFRGGVDMRPTLLRVLTDLYVQKLTHTPDEERHYTELAIRLLDAVDVPTRAAVAARLARHLSPPTRVIQFLAGDLPAVAAALVPPPAVQSTGTASEPSQGPAFSPIAENSMPDHALDHKSKETRVEKTPAATTPHAIDPAVASELNELFFAANANERRLILLNLDIVVPVPERIGRSLDSTIGLRLETAALSGNREVFARQLASALHITREQAHRIARDELGEPIVVAAKTLNIPRDVLYRILLFVNTAVGHSVERVHTLAELYDELKPRVADDMVAMWQALHKDDSTTAPPHQPVLRNDEIRARARPNVAAANRAPAMPGRTERRGAS